MIPCKKKNNRTLRKCEYNPKQVVNFLIIYGNSMTVPWYMMLIDGWSQNETRTYRDFSDLFPPSCSHTLSHKHKIQLGEKKNCF